LEVPGKIDRVFFLKLKLSDGKTVLSENFYWSPAGNGDCQALNTLKPVKLLLAAHLATDGSEQVALATVTNTTASVACAIRLKLVRSTSGERVLPAMYEDNYFSLLSGESRTISIHFPLKGFAGEALRLRAEGWNIQPSELPVQPKASNRNKGD
jgi:hypothetical protein